MAICSAIKTNYKNLYESLFDSDPRRLYFFISRRPDKIVDDGYYIFEDFGSEMEHRSEIDIISIIDKYHEDDNFLAYDIEFVTRVLIKFREFCLYRPSRWIEYIYILCETIQDIDNRGCTEIDMNIVQQDKDELTKYIKDVNLHGSDVVIYTK